jgi:hypothetical protein
MLFIQFAKTSLKIFAIIIYNQMQFLISDLNPLFTNKANGLSLMETSQLLINQHNSVHL